MTRDTLHVLSHLPEALIGPVRDAVPGCRITVIPTKGPIDESLHGRALLTMAWGAANVAEALGRGVEWVHCYGTGIDHFPVDALSGQLLTCSRGASAVPISEWVMAMLLSAEKRIPESWIHAPPEHWNRAELGGLHGRTLGLVGFGAIAKAVAQRALPFGMKVLAHRRTERPAEIPDVEIVRDLDALLAASDHLVIAAPATPKTRHLIDSARLSKLKPGAHLVNIARGDLVDQDALRDALEDGRVGLASLDVVDPEPLPAGHWLFTHPRVRLSPHISWCMPDALDELMLPFITNLQRFLAGESLEGMVDLEQGY